ncbi:MAG: radical SAM protein [Fusobacteriaceae bacterium]|nr:radical SAM protein [Fusobacteriaceae bacterium]
MRHYNIPIFINHSGCPHTCVFCDQRKINGVETDASPESIKAAVDAWLKAFRGEGTVEAAFFGGTFTGLSLSTQERFLKTLAPYLEGGQISGIRLSTRPDAITPENLDLLQAYGVKTVELGVQSLDPAVLHACGRRYDKDCVAAAASLIVKAGFRLGVQVMPGLPRATAASDFDTCRILASFHPHEARIYPTLVIKNTKLDELWQNGEYTPLSLQKSLEISKKIYSFFQIHDITVIRTGLCPDEHLRASLVAGPWHPAYLDLLKGELCFDFFHALHEKEKTLDIITHEKNLSSAAGHGGKNKSLFSPHFTLKPDRALSTDAWIINGRPYTTSDFLRFQLDHLSL